MDKSNNYIIGFALAIVLVSALLLSGVSEWLKPTIKLNEKIEKQTNILLTAGVEDFTDLQLAYSSMVKEVVVDKSGEAAANPEISPLLIDLNKSKRAFNRDNSLPLNYPLYEVTKEDGTKIYVLQVSGVGLWGPIWGYVGLAEDLNTVVGTVFDHKTETPGLGSEIAEDWFEEQFIGKKILDAQNQLTGIGVCKKSDKSFEEANRVSAISGATITGDGVSDMLIEDLAFYMNYFNK